MGAFVRIAFMNSFVAVLFMFGFFIAGFWLGVHAYRDQLRRKL